jgi:long-chain acyl-CoA synthetase
MINTSDYSKAALITRDEAVTYRELLSRIDGYASIYSGRGFSKISIYSENRAEWIYAFYAGWKNDCIVVPIDFLASAEDVAYILEDCRPDLVFTSPANEENLLKAIRRSRTSPEVMVFGRLPEPGPAGDLPWDVPGDSEKTSVILYTSGTTGNPKGVMLSFRNLQANIQAVSQEVKIFTPERQVLALLPMHHIFPLAGSMAAPLAAGGTIVLSPSMQSSDIIETLRNNRVNIMIGVPRLYELLYKSIRAKIYASLTGRVMFRLMRALQSPGLAQKIFRKVHQGLGGHMEMLVSGGAALNKEVGVFFKTLGFEVLEGYGMTEAAPMITFPRPGKAIIGTTGQPLPGMEVEIRDGEVVAKGPNIMQGYYNKPEETAETIRDGWLYTGDLGEIDKKGYLRITGRKKELIILPNGKNISPVELEHRLETMAPCIREAAVLMHNDLLHAIILPDLNALAEKGVKDPEHYFREKVFPEFNEELTSYKRIMQFTLVRDELPKTRLGKIQRHRLGELAGKPRRKASDPTETESEEYLAVKSFLENQVEMAISPDDHLEFDIALDSLGKLSLIDYIEKTFGVRIEEDKLLKFPSVKLMVQHIKANKRWHRKDADNWSGALKEKADVALPKTWATMTILKNLTRGFFKVYFRFRGEGCREIPDGPCILAPNHQSFIDGLILAACMRGRTIRETYFYAKKKHVNNRFLRFMASKHNIIVMDINKDLKESIHKLAEVLRQGKKIVIFPEGTRTRSGQLGEFKKTFAILSKELDIPVVPVAIDGAFRAMPGKAILPRPFVKINVRFLNPVSPGNMTLEALTEKVTAEIREAISQ